LPILVNASTQLSTTLAGARISVGITGTVRSRSRSPRMVVMVLPVPGSSKISAWPRSAIIRAPSTWYDRGVSPSGSSTVNSPLPERSRSVYWLAIHCCRRGIGCQYGPSACASCTTAGHVAGISSALPSALEIRGVRCLMWCAIVLIAYGCPLASSTMCVSSAVRSPTSTPSLYAAIGLPFGQLRRSRSGTGAGTVPDDHTLTCQAGRAGASRGYAPDRRSSGGLTSQLCQQRRLLRGQPRSRIVRGVARRGGLLLGGRCRVRGRRGLRLRPRRTLVGHREHVLRNRDPGELSLFDERDRNDRASLGGRARGNTRLGHRGHQGLPTLAATPPRSGALGELRRRFIHPKWNDHHQLGAAVPVVLRLAGALVGLRTNVRVGDVSHHRAGVREPDRLIHELQRRTDRTDRLSKEVRQRTADRRGRRGRRGRLLCGRCHLRRGRHLVSLRGHRHGGELLLGLVGLVRVGHFLSFLSICPDIPGRWLHVDGRTDRRSNLQSSGRVRLVSIVN